MHNIEHEEDELLTTAQVAEMTGWSVTTVNRKAAAGDLPVVVKASGKRGPRFFRKADVKAAIKANSTRTAS